MALDDLDDEYIEDDYPYDDDLDDDLEDNFYDGDCEVDEFGNRAYKG